MAAQIRRLLLLILLIVSAVSTTASTQSQSTVDGAYVTWDGLIIVANGRQTTLPGDPTTVHHLSWHPSGRWLVFSRYDANYMLNTFVYDAETDTTTQLSTNASFLPATFAEDTVLFAEPQAPSADAQQPLTLYTATPGGDASVAAESSVGVGCGGGSPFPMDTVYNNEAGFGGRGLLLAQTDAGILHSTNCTGAGVVRVGETTETISATYSRAHLSPDGTRFAAVDESNGQIVVASVDGSERTTYAPQSPVDQLTWGDANTLYYSSRTLIDLPLPLTPEEADAVARVLGLAADGIPQYTVSVQRLDLNGGETRLFEAPGWAVGRIQAGNGGIYFSLIANGETWVEALENGDIDPMAANSFQQAWNSVTVTLMRVPTAGGAPIEVGTGMHQFTLRP